MSELFLIGRIGPTWVGLPAEQVEAVVPLAEAVAVPHAPRGVRGIVAIRSRLLALIDSSVVAGCGTASHDALMVIVTSGGHGYALTLDAVDDVVPLDPIGPVIVQLDHAWQSLASAMADHAGRAILIVEPARLIESAQTEYVDAA